MNKVEEKIIPLPKKKILLTDQEIERKRIECILETDITKCPEKCPEHYEKCFEFK
jgi:hypothetical protein